MWYVCWGGLSGWSYSLIPCLQAEAILNTFFRPIYNRNRNDRLRAFVGPRMDFFKFWGEKHKFVFSELTALPRNDLIKITIGNLSSWQVATFGNGWGDAVRHFQFDFFLDQIEKSRLILEKIQLAISGCFKPWNIIELSIFLKGNFVRHVPVIPYTSKLKINELNITTFENIDSNSLISYWFALFSSGTIACWEIKASNDRIYI